MRKTLSDFRTTKLSLPDLESEAERKVIAFARRAFGCSEWVTLHGAQKSYYFNLDKAYSRAAGNEVAQFHEELAKRIEQIAKACVSNGSNDQPILAFVCPGGAPAGIVQARGALAERLGWQSVLVFPDKRLLRSRVIIGQDTDHYPDAVQWVAGRLSLLLADTTTTGESLARATGALRAFNCEPIAALTVYERNEGAEASLLTIGLQSYSLLRSQQVAASGLVDEDTKNALSQPAPPITRDLSVFASSSA